MSYWNQTGFPDPGSEMAGRLFYYHDLVMVVVVMVMVLVAWFLVIFLFNSLFFGGSVSRYVYKHEGLETFWTITPSLFLGVLGYFSLTNLYDMEVGASVDYLLKVTGHQWYWSYRYEVDFNKVFRWQYTDYLMTMLNDGLSKDLDLLMENSYEALSWEQMFSESNFMALLDSEYLFDNFLMLFNVSSSSLEGMASLYLAGEWFLSYDSYLVSEEELLNDGGGFRNQDVSLPCVIAHSMKNEILVSTVDVMHSWGCAELGVKVDAIPGRNNAISVEPVMPGMAFGNCYELCGEGHSQMPIVVLITCYNNMICWVKEQILLTEPAKEMFQSM